MCKNTACVPALRRGTQTRGKRSSSAGSADAASRSSVFCLRTFRAHPRISTITHARIPLATVRTRGSPSPIPTNVPSAGSRKTFDSPFSCPTVHSDRSVVGQPVVSYRSAGDNHIYNHHRRLLSGHPRRLHSSLPVLGSDDIYRSGAAFAPTESLIPRTIK